MSEYFFSLSKQDQAEVIEYGRSNTGRPSHLLEKDIWVVWTLSSLFNSNLKDDLTFKGGTSLSKVYKIIDRFSEDIDLTYDIRKIIPDILVNNEGIPPNRSQANKWTKEIRKRLPIWIEENVLAVLQNSLSMQKIDAKIEIDSYSNDKLLLHYPALTKLNNKALAKTVAIHKSHFFVEKDKQGQTINYFKAVAGKIKLIPIDAGMDALEKDYHAMLDDNILVGNAMPFQDLLKACLDLEEKINKAMF